MALVCGALPLAPFVVDRRRRLRRGRGWDRSIARRAPRVGAWLVGRRGRRRAHRRGADRADGGASAVLAALARRRLPVRVVVRVARPELPRRCSSRPAPSAATSAGSWFGAFNHWEMAGWYAGALTVLLAPRRPGAAPAGAVGARRRGAPRRPARVRRRHAGAPLLLPLRAALRRAALSDARAGDGPLRAADPGGRGDRVAVGARRHAPRARRRRRARASSSPASRSRRRCPATDACPPPVVADAPRVRAPGARRRRRRRAGGAARRRRGAPARRRARRWRWSRSSISSPSGARWCSRKPRRLGRRHRALRRGRLAAGATSDRALHPRLARAVPPAQPRHDLRHRGRGRLRVVHHLALHEPALHRSTTAQPYRYPKLRAGSRPPATSSASTRRSSTSSTCAGTSA